MKQIEDTKILISDVPIAKDTYHQKRKKHKLFCKRAGKEPTIGHLKEEYRLSRNFYKGEKGAIKWIIYFFYFKMASIVLIRIFSIISKASKNWES